MSFGVPPNGGGWSEYLKQRDPSVVPVEVVDEECLHNACSICQGTGIKYDGSPCIHVMICPCKKCKHNQ